MATFAAFSPEDGSPIPVTLVPIDQAGEHDNAQGGGTLAADKTVNSLLGPLSVDPDGHTLTVDTGGILNCSVSNGTLLPGESSGGELFVHGIEGQPVQLAAAVADTSFGKTTLTLSGSVVSLRGRNSHTGGTYVNGDRYNRQFNIDSQSLPTGTDLTINSALALINNLVSLNTVTLRGGSVGNVDAESWLIEDGALGRLFGDGTMRKVGLGKAVFQGENPLYSGTIDIEGGWVEAKGSPLALGTGLVRVHADALLSGDRALDCSVELCGGSLAISRQPAIVTADSILLGGLQGPMAGSLIIQSGAALQCDLPTSFAGDLRVDGSLLNSGPVQLAADKILSGSGLINDQVIMTLGAILSPGDSAGTLSVGSAIWRKGGIYRWEIADASGLPGEGWDLFDIERHLWTDLGATDSFTLQFMGGGADGEIDHFQPSHDYEWLIARTPLLRTFDRSRFTIDTTDLADELAGGTIELVAVPDGLALRYAAVPEPSASAVLLLALGLRRRRSRI